MAQNGPFAVNVKRGAKFSGNLDKWNLLTEEPMVDVMKIVQADLSSCPISENRHQDGKEK